MPQLLMGAGGFLAGILWMHLMFDFQALGHSGAVPDDVVVLVAAYYRHVTQGADPMGNVVHLVMILAVLGTVLQLSRGNVPLWLRAGALVAALVPLLYTLTVIDPAASRLGAGDAARHELIRTVLVGHSASLAFVLAFIGLQALVVRRERAPAGAR